MSLKDTRIKVFAGLSIDKSDVEQFLPGATYSPPIKRGDVLLSLKEGFHVLVIIDGRFQQAMAVSPNELMDALRCGLRIYGSSSMGAMRAVELEPFGMIGYGKIFEHIRDTPYFRDDYLGQAYDASMSGVAGEPYINLSFSLETLEKAGEISSADREILESTYRQMHFSERDLVNLRFALKKEHEEDCERLLDLAQRALESHSQKRIDGLGLLKQVQTDLAGLEKSNQQLALLAGEVPQFEGMTPSPEEFEKEKEEIAEKRRTARANVLRGFLSNRIASRDGGKDA